MRLFATRWCLALKTAIHNENCSVKNVHSYKQYKQLTDEAADAEPEAQQLHAYGRIFLAEIC